MNQRQLSILYSLHSWAGVVTGLLLFIICFSGAVVVFKNEIDLWANPSLKDMPRVAQPIGVDAVIADAKRKYPLHTIENIVVPNEIYPNYFVFLKEGKNERIKYAARADTGELTQPVESQLGQYIRVLHVFLFFGPRWIVGFLGVAMLVLIGTGIFIHTKIVKELYTQRWRRSFRLVASDLHKVAGIWGLGFHILIAFTGAWIGLAPVFTRAYDFAMAPPATEVAMKKDKAFKVDKADKALLPMLAVDPLLTKARTDLAGFDITSMSVQHAGKANAILRINGNLDDNLASTAHIHYSMVDGKIIKKHDPRVEGFWSQANSLMEPLHFGDFGGIGLKILYFFLGMTPAILSLSGTLLWLDRRKKMQRESASLVGIPASDVPATSLGAARV